MTAKERAGEAWDEPHLSDEPIAVIELDDGTLLYASQDYEGNGPGALFGQKGEECFTLDVSSLKKEKP